MVLRPQVLLLDEPFSQLDAALRVEMRQLVRRLHDETGVTSVFVTHDQTEAVDVADTIILMLDGRLIDQGRPQDFYDHPPSLAAARFFGVTNELAGDVADGTFTCDCAGLQMPSSLADGRAIAVVRPEALRLASCAAAHSVAGTAVASRFGGTHVAVDVEVGDGLALTVHERPDSPTRLGVPIRVVVAPEHCTIFPLGPQ